MWGRSNGVLGKNFKPGEEPDFFRLRLCYEPNLCSLMAEDVNIARLMVIFMCEL